MFYEEKTIDGVLNYRTSPDTDWTPFTAMGLTIYIRDLREDLRKLCN